MRLKMVELHRAGGKFDEFMKANGFERIEDVTPELHVAIIAAAEEYLVANKEKARKPGQEKLSL